MVDEGAEDRSVRLKHPSGFHHGAQPIPVVRQMVQRTQQKNYVKAFSRKARQIQRIALHQMNRQIRIGQFTELLDIAPGKFNRGDSDALSGKLPGIGTGSRSDVQQRHSWLQH